MDAGPDGAVRIVKDFRGCRSQDEPAKGPQALGRQHDEISLAGVGAPWAAEEETHGERRAREMEEVASTLRESGIEPIMAEATARRMDWAAGCGLREHFGGEFPKSYKDVLEAVLVKR